MTKCPICSAELESRGFGSIKTSCEIVATYDTLTFKCGSSYKKWSKSDDQSWWARKACPQAPAENGELYAK